MKNNWTFTKGSSDEYPPWNDFDDYGYGEDHNVSIGDEIESFDRSEMIHTGVVVGIIRDINGHPVCYKIWDGEQDCFDYVPSSGSIVCEPCGSSKWALERIGYTRHDEAYGHGLYRNDQTGDVIVW